MIDILMPRLSDTMEDGAIAAWHKKLGETVSPGDVLVEIETDKAVMEQESYEAGTLAEILVAEGENVAIGTPIARLDDGTGDAPPTPRRTHENDAAPHKDAAARDSTSPRASALPSPRGEDGARRIVATPLVRRLAHDRGIDLTSVVGTGPGGRIVRADLPDERVAATQEAPLRTERTAASAPVAPDAESVPFDRVRQAIASRLTESAATVPSFTATTSADVEALLGLRAELNVAMEATETKISVNDLIVRAVALALRAHPGVNASYSPEGRGETRVHPRVNVGVAVAAPGGLMVPVVRDADQASVSAIGSRIRMLSAKAADRSLSPDEMADGTFTVSNLGMHGVEHFTAIINPPQGAILAVGAALPELRLVDGETVERRRMRYTITADHRIIDGALAARFLADLTELLEHPFRIVA